MNDEPIKKIRVNSGYVPKEWVKFIEPGCMTHGGQSVRLPRFNEFMVKMGIKQSWSKQDEMVVKTSQDVWRFALQNFPKDIVASMRVQINLSSHLNTEANEVPLIARVLGIPIFVNFWSGLLVQDQGIMTGSDVASCYSTVDKGTSEVVIGTYKFFGSSTPLSAIPVEQHMEYVILHEMGHAVYYKRMAEETELWKKTKSLEGLLCIPRWLPVTSLLPEQQVFELAETCELQQNPHAVGIVDKEVQVKNYFLFLMAQQKEIQSSFRESHADAFAIWMMRESLIEKGVYDPVAFRTKIRQLQQWRTEGSIDEVSSGLAKGRYSHTTTAAIEITLNQMEQMERKMGGSTSVPFEQIHRYGIRAAQVNTSRIMMITLLDDPILSKGFDQELTSSEINNSAVLKMWGRDKMEPSHLMVLFQDLKEASQTLWPKNIITSRQEMEILLDSCFEHPKKFPSVGQHVPEAGLVKKAHTGVLLSELIQDKIFAGQSKVLSQSMQNEVISFSIPSQPFVKKMSPSELSNTNPLRKEQKNYEF